ncbi:TY5A [Symbiodinium sp. CCMP2592]|nr:TY5A [Symbiodinium sp. CCMP2592]
MEGGPSMRYFSGDDGDHREYRRWKQWIQSKIPTMDDLPKEARGAFIFTLLQGRALEVVEHLKPEEYQKDGGDRVLLELLDKRWPQKDRMDELGEHVSEVFLLAARDGETIRNWSSRAQEVFDRCNRCKRKTEVTFPEEAVVLARCGGSLKFDDVSQAMRSCYPEYVVPKRRVAAAHYVEDENEAWYDYNQAEASGEQELFTEELETAFGDVEMFLTEHDLYEPVEEVEVYPERDVAEVLAVSCLLERQAGGRVEEEDTVSQMWPNRPLGSRVQTASLVCGFWRRPSGAGLIQHQLPDFICSVTLEAPGPGPGATLLDRMRSRSLTASSPMMLISSPGYAVLDSGCGRSVIGLETLNQFRRLWQEAGMKAAVEVAEQNSFRFGNGHLEVSNRVVEMPLRLAGKAGVVRAAVIRGKAPLPLSRPALKKLKACLDFANDAPMLFKEGVRIPLQVNEAGQYVVPVIDQNPECIQMQTDRIVDEETTGSEDSVAMLAPRASDSKVTDHDYWECQGMQVIRVHVQPRRNLFDPLEVPGCPVSVEQLQGQRRTLGILSDGSPLNVSDDWHVPSQAVPGSCWTGRTVFEVCPPPAAPAEPAVPLSQWTRRQRRQLKFLAKRETKKPAGENKQRFQVIEVFGPPQFANVAITKGYNCLSADRATGWDFRNPTARQELIELVRAHQPVLVVIGNPCSWLGGWYDLDSPHLSAAQHTERERMLKLMCGFAADVAQVQLSAGRHLVFEQLAATSGVRSVKLERLEKQMFPIQVSMCAFGLKSPDNGVPLRKTLRFLVSHAHLRSLGRACPGHSDHVSPAGSRTSLGRFAAQYPPAFVRMVLRSVKGVSKTEALRVQAQPDKECLVAARVQQLNEQKGEQMLRSLLRLHVNLGHPSCASLARVLKHGGASQQAIELAREVECDVCRAQKPPVPPPPAQTNRATHFNQRVGLDVKYLPGWQPNQKIPCLNIVDYASSYQVMVPLPGRATGESLRQALQEPWVTWAGIPEEIIVDPDQANLSAALTVPQELAGSHISSTAAEAHWQLGKVEVHGGWFSRVLEKVLAEVMPHDRAAWLECVYAAHCKNELIQVYGMTPAQYVFGRNPRVPTDLLDEPLQVIPATASLYEEGLARRVATRQAARHAVIALQDDKALRLGLQARTRTVKAYAPGARVAYWRTQKSHEGVIERGGRWYGPAVVLGYVGRNLVVIHKKQILRCAPEQVRPSTSEEETLLDTPGLELLGIKQMLENGAISTKQYVDVISEGVPPASSSEERMAAEESAEHRAPAVAAPPPPLQSESPQQAFRNQPAPSVRLLVSQRGQVRSERRLSLLVLPPI